MMPEPSASSSIPTDRGAADRGRLRALGPWLYRSISIAASSLVLARSVMAVWSFTIDDAGISYAYAKHIAEGLGPVAAPGAPWVEGYSNPLWVFLLVPFHLVGLPLPVMAKVIGVAACVSTLAAATVCLRAREGRRWYAIGASDALYAVAIGASLECVIWAVAGLENPLFMCLSILLAALSVKDGSAARVAAAFTAFGLSITRPEGVAYAAAWVAIELFRAYRHAWRRDALRGLLFFATPLVLYHAVHYAVFRQLVPNTYLAKPASRDLADGFQYLRSELWESGLVWALPLALAGLVRGGSGKLVLLWYCCVGAVFVLYSGGDWMPHGRFIALFAPALLLLAVHGVENAAAFAKRLARGRIEREPFALIIAVALGVAWWRYQAPRIAAVERERWCHFCDRVADSNSLKQLTRRAGLAGASLLTHDFGGPAWTSSASFHPIDFLGLCDRSVALIRRDRTRRGGSIGEEPRLYQYLLHEQASPPTWIYLPSNFWPRLDRSPEYRAGYVRLSRASMPRAPANTVLGLHRSEFVDYFPPTQRFEFASLGANLVLLGWSAFVDASAGVEGGELRAGSPIRVSVSVSSSARRGADQQLVLRLEAGSERVETPPRALLPLAELSRKLGSGQPISLEFAVTMPDVSAPSVALSLGAGPRGAAPDAPSWTFHALGTFAAGSRLSVAGRALPRYPAALPSATDADLRSFQAPIARMTELRRRTGDLTLGDRDLARQLTSLGARLEARNLPDQAYVAYVWATQAWRASWRDLADVIHRLRPPLQDGRQAMELLLLGEYYSSGDADSLSRLLAFFVEMRALTEIEYFLERAPDYRLPPELQTALDRMRAETLAPLAPLGAGTLPAALVHEPAPGLDFETASLDGWDGDLERFGSGSASGLVRLRGQHGKGVLSSLRGGKRARGEVLSPEFTLVGGRLSLLVAGSRRLSGVELVVDGRAVASAHGNDSDSMYPELWDVSAYQGRRARLRVFDQDTRGYVLLDRVLSWL